MKEVFYFAAMVAVASLVSTNWDLINSAFVRFLSQ